VAPSTKPPELAGENDDLPGEGREGKPMNLDNGDYLCGCGMVGCGGHDPAKK
jgi:hypothetical protein